MLLEHARDVTPRGGIYLKVGLVSLLPTNRYRTVEIRAILLGPASVSVVAPGPPV